jgi:hypothetical protein
MVHALPAWLSQGCAALFGARTPPVSSTDLENVRQAMGHELFRANQYTHHKFRPHIKEFDFISHRQMGLEIKPELAADFTAVRPVMINLFANPAAVDLDWTDRGADLAAAPSLLLIYEDVPVRDQGGRDRSVAELFQQGLTETLKSNPTLQARLRVMTAEEFPRLNVDGDLTNHKILWLEGGLKNFQVKRIMLLETEKVYGAIANDPRYAVRNPAKGPQRGR